MQWVSLEGGPGIPGGGPAHSHTRPNAARLEAAIRLESDRLGLLAPLGAIDPPTG